MRQYILAKLFFISSLFSTILFFTQSCYAQGNLDYAVDTWSSPVTKQEVKEMRSMLDFWSDDTKSKYKQDAFRDIWVVNLKDYHDWTIDVNEISPSQKASSPTENFTSEQLELIANADYSDHLRFSARFNSTKIETGEVEENILISQSVSVVPDVQAVFEGGMNALVNHIKIESDDLVKGIKREEVGRCRIFFTVTSEGLVDKVRKVESSNYPEVDKALIEIVKNMPELWTPAENGNGEKVEQEFVFTFGMAGC